MSDPRPVATREGRSHLPRLVYGTAWKKDQTADLVYAAIQAGFRGIDTAAQPKHYREDLVALGVQRALQDGLVASRDDLYVQTKFTPLSGQDLSLRTESGDGMPYDPTASLEVRVKQSVEQSLALFGGRLDCVLLHSPLPTHQETVAAWHVLEGFVRDGRVRTLGISNVRDVDDVEILLSPSNTTIRPSIVQNRFYRAADDPGHSYDRAVRALCARPDVDIVYQSFWTLTANGRLLRRPALRAAATAASASPETMLYALLVDGLGRQTPGHCRVVVLDGTTSSQHMAEDLAALDQIQAWREADGQQLWAEALADLQATVGVAEGGGQQ